MSRVISNILAIIATAGMAVCADTAPAPPQEKTAPAWEAQLPYSTDAPIPLNLRLTRTPTLDTEGNPRKGSDGEPIDKSFAGWIELKSIQFNPGGFEESFSAACTISTEADRLSGFGISLSLLDQADRILCTSFHPVRGPLAEAASREFQLDCEVPVRLARVREIKHFKAALCELEAGDWQPAFELKALLASDGAAWREGRCIVVAGHGHDHRFCDMHHGFDGRTVFDYRGLLGRTGLHLISVSAYEEGWHILLDAESGRETILPDEPKLSPDGRWLATGIINEMDGDTAARIYRVTKTGAEVAWEYTPKDYPGGKDQPLVEPRWTSATEVRFRIESSDPDEKEPRLASVKLTDGRWKREKHQP